MKKILCVILALTLFVGAYFSLPKSIGLTGTNDVYAAEWAVTGHVAKTFTIYYYNRLGSKRSATFKPGDELDLVHARYYSIFEWDGHRTYKYSFDMQKYIDNGKIYIPSRK
ncbi:MAG: hypothetical protein K6F83_09085 [Clostridiales bacterium]|nr:hypothetical protein [Clostridiales bacterium]